MKLVTVITKYKAYAFAILKGNHFHLSNIWSWREPNFYFNETWYSVMLQVKVPIYQIRAHVSMLCYLMNINPWSLLFGRKNLVVYF